MKTIKRLLRIELTRCLECPYFRHYPAATNNDGYCQYKHRFQFTVANMNAINDKCPLDVLPTKEEIMDKIKEQQIMESPHYMLVIED